jgi:hypothetical protein
MGLTVDSDKLFLLVPSENLYQKTETESSLRNIVLNKRQGYG